MDSVLTWVAHYGYAGLFLLLAFGIVGLPVPDETLLVFSGFLISTGRFHPGLAFASGFFGSTTGISVSYLLGRVFGYNLVQRFGKYIHLSPKRVSDVNGWFHRAGHWLLTFGYYIPGVRHFTALVAGMSNLEYPTFAAFAYPGAALWVSTFLALGYFVGDAWPTAFKLFHRYMVWAILAAFLIGGVIWYVRRSRKLAV